MTEAARPDLIVVGHAGFASINRNVYVELNARGLRTELVLPRHLPGLDGAADPERKQDPPIHWVHIKGTNQRFWDFDLLLEILDSRRPRTLLLEGDPASRLAIKMARWA